MIKKITFEDIELIIEIEREAFSEPWSLASYQELYKDYNSQIYVVYEEDMVVAYAVYLDMVDVFELVRIAVKKDFRGKKIGNSLLKKSIDELDKNIFLEVRENNQIAINMYKNNGFESINRRKNYYKDTNEDAIIMLYNK